MEVVAGDLPFQRRNVVEWSHRDRLTGALERARRETNHWSASTASAIHNYNKVVDQRAVNLADGRVQQSQRKQLEVFSTQVPGGSLQVFRSSTTSSSRSSFQFTQVGSGTWSTIPDVDTAFGDLKLSLHPLDLSSEKTKASVGRSIGWRRPPSRVPRGTASAASAATAANRQDEDPVKETHVEITVEDDKPTDSNPIISFPSDDDSSERTTSRHSAAESVIVESRKSCSSENLVKVGVDGDLLSHDSSVNSGGAVNGFLGRSSVLRRSLQYTRPPDFPTGASATSVRRMREEIEARGVVGVAGGGGVPVSPSASPVSALPKEQTLDKVKRLVSGSIATQNHSFVTVKSLNEVRGRLRSKAVDSVKAVNGDEGGEGGEVSEGEDAVVRRPRVQSYVFGMEGAVNNAEVRGGDDGKLAVNGVRSEEWYRRRKSYGFEPNLTPQNQDLISLKESKEDSWSDSGTFCSAISFPSPPLLKHLDVIKRSKDAVNKSLVKETTVVVNDEKETNGYRAAGDEASPKKTVVSLVGDDSDMARRRDLLRRKAEREIMKQGLSVNIPVIADVADDGEPTLLVNGFHFDDDETKRHSVVVVEEDDDAKQSLSDSAEDPVQCKKKKVEFSKTEVHFAAEPGRFNLVSTDDKPPPTNIVRGRRRQKLLAEQRINKSGLPEVRFGDNFAEHTNKGTKGAVITITMEGKLSPNHPNGAPDTHGTNERPQAAPIPTNQTSDDDEQSRVVRSTDTVNRVPMWRSTVTLKNNSFATPSVSVLPPKGEGEGQGQAEFQRLLKSLRPTGRRDVSSVEVVPEITVTTSLSPTVRSKGYSTKVNLGSPDTNGVPSHTGAFVSQLSHDSVEPKPALHSLNLSRLGLESTPLVLLANCRGQHRRRRTRASRRSSRPSPGHSEDDDGDPGDLSDESLQADAEVRAYMVEKSSRVHLAVLGVSKPESPDASRYRHHASKAERLVQLDELHRVQPVQPAQPVQSPTHPRGVGVYLVPEQRKSGFTAVARTSSPTQIMPKSFSLVDSVTKKAVEDSDVRTVSVRDILNRLSDTRTEHQGEERIIEVVNREVSDAGTTGKSNHPDCGRVNGLITDSVIFRDYRPTSPGDFKLAASNQSGPDRIAADRLTTDRITTTDRLTTDRLTADRSYPDRARVGDGEEVFRPRRLSRRASPLVPPVNGKDPVDAREFLHARAPPGGHHTDIVEKFLRSERGHHDERHRRSRSPSKEPRHRSREPEDDAQHGVRRRRSRSRDELLSEERRRRSHSRDKRHADERRRSRSRDELNSDERRRRSRSRDERHSDDRRRESRSRDDFRGVDDGRRRSRSRDELDRVEPIRDRRSRSRSQDELEVDRRHRDRGHFEISKSAEQRRVHHEAGRSSSRCRDDANREELVADVVSDAQVTEDAGLDRRHRDVAQVKPSDRKRPEVHHAKERQPEAAERRHRCKCAERGGGERGDAAKTRPAERGRSQAGQAAEKASRTDGNAGSQGAAMRRTRAVVDKGEKLVRKTRTHVAAMASPLAHMVKPSRRQADSKKTGDVHIVIEPIRPVRRVAPGKPSAAVPSTTSKGGIKVAAQKRPSGTASDSNSSLSQGRNAAPSLLCTERPARRNNRKHTSDS